MHEIVNTIQWDIDEITRMAKQAIESLATSDRSISPIRYRNVLEELLRIRVIWTTHQRLSEDVYAFLEARDPRFGSSLNELASQQRHLSQELKLLTPAIWPRSAQLGLNSLRIRAFHTLPLIMLQLEHEELTVLPLLRRWVYGGAIPNSIVERELCDISEMASA